MVAVFYPLIGQNVTTLTPDWMTWSYLTPPESLTLVFVPSTSHWCVEPDRGRDENSGPSSGQGLLSAQSHVGRSEKN